MLAERIARLEGRVEEQGRMFDTLREAIGSLERRMDQRFESMDGKLSRQFMWLVGFQVTTLAAIVAALMTR